MRFDSSMAYLSRAFPTLDRCERPSDSDLLELIGRPPERAGTEEPRGHATRRKSLLNHFFRCRGRPRTSRTLDRPRTSKTTTHFNQVHLSRKNETRSQKARIKDFALLSLHLHISYRYVLYAQNKCTTGVCCPLSRCLNISISRCCTPI